MPGLQRHESTHRVNRRREVGWRIRETSGSGSFSAEGTWSEPRGSGAGKAELLGLAG